jgi:hypothetical protein
MRAANDVARSARLPDRQEDTDALATEHSLGCFATFVLEEYSYPPLGEIASCSWGILSQ